MKRALDDVLSAVAENHQEDRQPWLVGSPFFDPPPELLSSLREAAARRRFDYPPSHGLPELRRGISELHGREGISLDPDQVVVTHGSKGGLFALFGCLLEAGDEVIYPIPTYPAYPALARQLGARAIPISQMGRSFAWSLDDLDFLCGERTRILVLSSPSNPSGASLSQLEAERLVGFCRSRGIRLVLDEAYEAFRFEEGRMSPATEDPNLETVVLLRSFSKSLAVCGWRIGYVATDAKLAARVATWQSALLNPPSSLAQHALAAFPEASAEYRGNLRSAVATRLEEIAALLRHLGLEAERPPGGFYLWVDFRDRLRAMGHSSASFCNAFAERSGLALWPGEDYEAPGWIRFSAVACDERSWPAECRRLHEELGSFMEKGARARL